MLDEDTGNTGGGRGNLPPSEIGVGSWEVRGCYRIFYSDFEIETSVGVGHPIATWSNYVAKVFLLSTRFFTSWGRKTK